METWEIELENNTRDAEGLGLLKQPVLPLVNMVEFLYLTGPFKKIKEVLSFNLPLDMICTSHGIIWRDKPEQIVEQYMTWADNYQENQITMFNQLMNQKQIKITGRHIATTTRLLPFMTGFANPTVCNVSWIYFGNQRSHWTSKSFWKADSGRALILTRSDIMSKWPMALKGPMKGTCKPKKR